MKSDQLDLDGGAASSGSATLGVRLNRRSVTPVHEEDEPRFDIQVGVLIAVLFFVVLLGWAAFARLDAAAMAPGRLVVSGERQTVQHRDGGVIGELLVKEGQKVTKGQVLIRLSAADVKGQERALSAQAITLLAQRARLQAEQSGSGTIIPPREFATLTSAEDQADAARAMQIQQAQLRTRLAVVHDQRGALGERSSGVSSLGQGYGSQVAAIDKQIKSLDNELNALREVAQKGFVSMSRVRALERSRAELEGQRGQNLATLAQTRNQAGESRLQSLEAQSTYLEHGATELRDVETALSEVLPKLNAARDQLARTQIRSPATGRVVGLQVFTPGGVIAPGQHLLDVIPDRVPMSVECRILPQDMDDVEVGKTALVRFDALHDRSLPPLEGRVTRMSADSITDEKTGATYFTASVNIPDSQLRLLKEARGPDFALRAGMPVTVEVLVRKRTALQYLLEPMSSALDQSGHEH